MCSPGTVCGVWKSHTIMSLHGRNNQLSALRRSQLTHPYVHVDGGVDDDGAPPPGPQVPAIGCVRHPDIRTHSAEPSASQCAHLVHELPRQSSLERYIIMIINGCGVRNTSQEHDSATQLRHPSDYTPCDFSTGVNPVEFRVLEHINRKPRGVEGIRTLAVQGMTVHGRSPWCFRCDRNSVTLEDPGGRTSVGCVSPRFECRCRERSST